MWLLIFLLLSLSLSVLALWRETSRSRRRLCWALILFLPGVGAILAIIVRRVRGGAVPVEPPRTITRRRPSAAQATHLGEVPPVLDRLLAGDPVERLEALVGLSSSGDASAVTVLRWARDHGPSEVVLDAALTLEELELRSEAKLLEARIALEAKETPERALAAADAAAASVLSGLADAPAARMLAEQARAWYGRAIALAPERASQIEQRLARLELAAGRPRVAWMIAERLIHNGAADRTLIKLRDDAAFAAREFAALSFVPAPLQPPLHLAAHRLHTVPA